MDREGGTYRERSRKGAPVKLGFGALDWSKKGLTPVKRTRNISTGQTTPVGARSCQKGGYAAVVKGRVGAHEHARAHRSNGPDRQRLFRV